MSAKFDGIVSSPTVKTSWGELIDKYTILQIKLERLTAPHALANVANELGQIAELVAMAASHVGPQIAELRRVNLLLWDIEDRIRQCERVKQFDDAFVQLARSVYLHNDERSALKRAISSALGSLLIEEKSYAQYRDV